MSLDTERPRAHWLKPLTALIGSPSFSPIKLGLSLGRQKFGGSGSRRRALGIRAGICAWWWCAGALVRWRARRHPGAGTSGPAQMNTSTLGPCDGPGEREQRMKNGNRGPAWCWPIFRPAEIDGSRRSAGPNLPNGGYQAPEGMRSLMRAPGPIPSHWASDKGANNNN